MPPQVEGVIAIPKGHLQACHSVLATHHKQTPPLYPSTPPFNMGLDHTIWQGDMGIS